MRLKGFYHLAISNRTRKRLDEIRVYMMRNYPDDYDETTSYHQIIKWMAENVNVP